jgi:hypothetical protein
MKRSKQKRSRKRGGGYSVTAKEFARFMKRANSQISRERETGKIKIYGRDLQVDIVG